MLQSDRSHTRVPQEEDELGFDPAYYYGIFKKRIFYIIIPFFLVLAAGSAAAILWPPTYLSEGKILVESQQIPADLVRPTVTASSKERIQVIEQRVMTRDNLLAIMDKYQLYADQRDRLSRTELLELMRENTRIQPLDLDQRRTDGLTTVALTVGFSNRRPEIATQVANELITLFLKEDARNRTNRAMETTKFLAREAQRLEGELASIELKISEYKRKNIASGPVLEQQSSPQLAVLKAELASKSAIYSKSHPEVNRLKRQIAALEKMVEQPETAAASAATAGPATSPTGVNSELLDALQTQRKSIQANLENASQKLTAARLGESLERDQFAERLQILEQAVPPQKPIKPNRTKIFGLTFLGALMAGVGGVLAVELLDRTIRGTRDLKSIADGHLIVTIPYISTRAELVRKKSRVVFALAAAVIAIVASLAAVHFLWRPLDELWTILLDRLIAARLLQ